MIIVNMQVTTPNLWMPRLSALVVGLLFALSAVYWVLRWPAAESGRALSPVTASDEVVAASAAELARLLGAQTAPTAQVTEDASNRIRLTGVIASPNGQGVALLSIDGKPAKAYRVGSQLEEGLVLQSVEGRRVALAADAKGPVHMRLELPAKQ